MKNIMEYVKNNSDANVTEVNLDLMFNQNETESLPFPD